MRFNLNGKFKKVLEEVNSPKVLGVWSWGTVKLMSLEAKVLFRVVLRSLLGAY